MKQIITTLTAALTIGSCAVEKTNTEPLNSEKMETKTELSNKEKASALLVSLETGDQTPVSYINPTQYTQHNVGVADGLEGFGAVLQHAPEGGFKANVVRSFQDGDYTFSHTIYDFFGPKIGFDIFKFESGQIVEHWDNLQETSPKPNPSGHSMTDGSTEIKDLDKTQANKKLVEQFISDILVNGKMDQLASYFDGDNYIQHNPQIGDGLSGLGAALEHMASQGITMKYNTIHKVLGEGNFVLTVSEGSFADKPTSFYDLFRIENGKIAEHWDVMETLIPASEHKNTNGKFNF